MGFGDHDTGILADTFCCPKRHKPVKRIINCWNRTDVEALKSDMQIQKRKYFICHSRDIQDEF